MIEVILNGKTVSAEPGTTILDLARQHGLSIPTLCHDKELNPYGSCWVCAVEVVGRRGFVTSCGTIISPGMEIRTESPEIMAARKMALELLISNHYADCEAPCKIACPNHVDVQSYVSLIANGQYHEAVKVIKNTLPMPLSIGRVCPAFCEVECRRKIVEDPIAIRQLKRFAADEDIQDFWTYEPEKAIPNGKSVAIVGAGPSGLTCAYYLSYQGYDVTLFESAPEAGGWLRYGIPEYRLPKDILDKEIALMLAGGAKIVYHSELGKDFSLGQLAADYDAVYLAIGAQKAIPMPVKGSDLQGCYLGVDFLKSHALGFSPVLGKKVAVVGGGNTAIDCARTSLRLGADVTIIYRRTREEMPADAFEIDAAEHEGIRFYMLSNPMEYLGEDGKLKLVRIEKMKLGEPDRSGRRRPEPTGEFFEERFDNIIAAISQVPEIALFAEQENYIGDAQLPTSRWDTAIVDEATMFTGLKNVFAGGDFRRGAATAIEAIADGRLAAESINQFIQTGIMKPALERFDSKRGLSLTDISPEEYANYTREARKVMPEIPVFDAATSFREVETGFLESEARAEAERCLECGCQVNETCLLREYCTDYGVDAARFLGSIGKHPIDTSHPFILRDINKCIDCGRCIRTCAEIQGPAVLGYIYRGFSTVVAPEFGESLNTTACESCGKCIAVCPVGALTERNQYYKLNPLALERQVQTCGLCGTGCVIQTQTHTRTVALINAPLKEEECGFNGRNLCFKGRFGWQTLMSPERLLTPRYNNGSGFKDISWTTATELLGEAGKYAGSKRMEISPAISLEEMLLAKTVSDNISAKYHAASGLGLFCDEMLPLAPDDNAYARLDEYEEYVVVGEISHTLRTMLRLKQRQGKSLVLVNPVESPFNRFADAILSSLDELSASPKQLFVYSLSRLSEQTIYHIWKLAASIDPSCHNIFSSSDYCNYWGILACKPSFDLPAASDLVLGWGVYPAKAEAAKFSAAFSLFVDDDAPVSLLLPMPSYLELDGSTLGNMGQTGFWHDPARSMIINEIMRLLYSLGWMSAGAAEVSFWNNAAQKLMDGLKEYRAKPFDAELDINSLRTEPAALNSIWERKIEEYRPVRVEQS